MSFSVYAIDGPSGPPLLITYDWNTNVTAAIAEACDSLVESFKVRPAPERAARAPGDMLARYLS